MMGCPSTQTLQPPGNFSVQPAWLASLREMRSHCRRGLNLSKNSLFEEAALKWTQEAYVQTQMHPYDPAFFNGTAYTVESWLDSLDEAYGGVDGALIWPTYPMLGFDDRNQFDIINSLPGGISAIKQVVSEMHGRGVRVLWPYNPWDTATAASATEDPQRLAQLIATTESDGFNGDTMTLIPREFFEASVKAGRPAAMQAEGGASLQSLGWTTLGWGEAGGWSRLPLRGPPLVAAYRWLQPRRMTNICRRNDRDRTTALQHAWFNGMGYESWQNLWGCWNGFTSRDGEALRRVSRLLRYFGARHFFQNDGWEPHTPTAKPSQLYASRFPRLPEESSCAAGGETLWAIVERAGTNVSGPALVVDAASYAGCHWWDVWHGRSLSPTLSGSQLTVVLDVEAAGFGCVLATPNGTGGIQSFRDDAQLEANTPLSRLLAQASSNRRALASYASASAGDSWRGGSEPWLPAQTRVRPPPSRAHMSAPPGAVPIAGTKTYQFTASGNVCAGGAVNNCPHIQYEWERMPASSHNHTVQVAAFFIDRYPVSCARFAEWLRRTSYSPADMRGFLRGWPDWRAGIFPPGNGSTPVTSVSYEEAKMFCADAGGRLPSSIEWQFAASGGNTSQIFPWGVVDDPTRRPRVNPLGRVASAPEASTAFEGNGSSGFGVADAVGNVWQWTEEWRDEHQRFAVLRGGSRYQLAGSWYPPPAQTIRLDRYSKYYLMGGGAWERMFTVGFRCAYEWQKRGAREQ